MSVMYQTTDKVMPKIEPLRLEDVMAQARKDHPTMPIEELKARAKKAIQEEYESRLRIFSNPRGM